MPAAMAGTGRETAAADLPVCGWARRLPHTEVTLSGAGDAPPHAAKAAAKAASPARRLSPRQPSPVVRGAPATGGVPQVWPRKVPREAPSPGVGSGPGAEGSTEHSPGVPVRV